MRRLAVVILALMLVGCSVGTSKPNEQTTKTVVERLAYIQDSRTGLCFAMISTSHALQVSDDGLSITWVPCEPKVMAQISK